MTDNKTKYKYDASTMSAGKIKSSGLGAIFAFTKGGFNIAVSEQPGESKKKTSLKKESFINYSNEVGFDERPKYDKNTYNEYPNNIREKLKRDQYRSVNDERFFSIVNGENKHGYTINMQPYDSTEKEGNIHFKHVEKADNVEYKQSKDYRYTDYIKQMTPYMEGKGDNSNFKGHSNNAFMDQISENRKTTTNKKKEAFSLSGGKKKLNELIYGKKKEHFNFHDQLFGKASENYVINKTENNTFIINKNIYQSMTQQTSNAVQNAVMSVCNSAEKIMRNKNDIKVKKMKVTGDNFNMKFDQKNIATIKIDTTFINNLTSELTASINTSITEQIVNNISQSTASALTATNQYNSNESALSTLTKFLPGKNSNTKIENTTENNVTQETDSEKIISKIVNMAIEQNDVKTIINDSVSVASNDNLVEIGGETSTAADGSTKDTSVEITGNNATIEVTQENIASDISNTLFKNNLVSKMYTSIIGDIQTLAEDNQQSSALLESSSNSNTEQSDSIFGSTGNFQLLIVAVVIIVIGIAVIKIFFGGSSSSSNNSDNRYSDDRYSGDRYSYQRSRNNPQQYNARRYNYNGNMRRY
jgi:hypothetical protein